jgi:DNA polymerase-3 subunit delta
MAKAAARSNLVPVYALVGPEPYLQGEALRRVVAMAGEDAQRVDVEGPQATPGEVFDELRSPAMFGGRRVVVVREADAFVSNHRASLEDYLKTPAPENVLVLRCGTLPKNQNVYKLAAKAGEVIDCQPPKGLPAVAKWAIKQAKQTHQLTVDPAAADLLADALGGDLGAIDNELAKLALRLDGGKVKAEDVAGGVAFRREQQMWTMTDRLTAGDAAGAVTIWRQLTATDASAEFRAVTWLALWLDKAGRAQAMRRDGQRPFDIAKELKVWPAKNIDPLLRSAEAMGAAGLRRATDRLAELDYQVKTGRAEAKRACEAFLATALR